MYINDELPIMTNLWLCQKNKKKSLVFVSTKPNKQTTKHSSQEILVDNIDKKRQVDNCLSE